MKGILWHVTRKLEGIFDGILMEFHMKISEDKNQIQKSMYIPRFLSSGLYGRVESSSIVGFSRAVAAGVTSRTGGRSPLLSMDSFPMCGIL